MNGTVEQEVHAARKHQGGRDSLGCPPIGIHHLFSHPRISKTAKSRMLYLDRMAQKSVLVTKNSQFFPIKYRGLGSEEFFRAIEATVRDKKKTMRTVGEVEWKTMAEKGLGSQGRGKAKERLRKVEEGMMTRENLGRFDGKAWTRGIEEAQRKREATMVKNEKGGRFIWLRETKG